MRQSLEGIVIRIVTCLALLALAGCGWDWFPSNNQTFANTSTAKRAFGNQSSQSAAKRPFANFSAPSPARGALTAVNYSTAGRQETTPAGGKGTN